MATATADTAHGPNGAPMTEPSLRDRVVDTARRVAHLSHEAQMLKSVATDAIDDTVYKARRAMKTARRDFDDVRVDAAYRIRREPLKSVGIAFGAGLAMAAALAGLVWVISSVGRHRADQTR